MRTSWRELTREYFAPLSLAAYVAWGAVWLTTDAAIAREPTLGWELRVALLGFLLLFVFERLWKARFGPRSVLVIGSLMAGLALWVISQTPFGASPILLVLLVAMMAAHLSGRGLLLFMLALNAGMAWIVFSRWPGSSSGLAINLLAHISFQVFAVLVMRYARQAEAMSEALRAVNADLVATRSLLEESARDAERLRLSRELHDVAGHALTALKLNLGALSRDVRQPDPERVQLCAGLADALLQNLRGVVRQMREHEGIDLRVAIERLAAPFPHPRVRLDIDTQARLSDIHGAEALLRAVQEGLTNAARHSGASSLWLSLKREGEQVRLTMHDDGRGTGKLQEGSGLSGMRERLQELGGELVIDQGPAGGLRLSACLPASRA